MICAFLAAALIAFCTCVSWRGSVLARFWNKRQRLSREEKLTDKLFRGILKLLLINMGHRVVVWVILYLLEHTGKDFQSEILLVT